MLTLNNVLMPLNHRMGGGLTAFGGRGVGHVGTLSPGKTGVPDTNNLPAPGHPKMRTPHAPVSAVPSALCPFVVW